MPVDKEQMQKMDDDAEKAKEELVAHLDEWDAKRVTKWWAEWYMRTGHKRLGRILVALAQSSRR